MLRAAEETARSTKRANVDDSRQRNQFARKRGPQPPHNLNLSLASPQLSPRMSLQLSP
jgi:hypothetical protein